eukprot:Protomagalhaensia_sp_Gyna_25__3328@NODE_300_length_4004_cov_227_496847_g232_i0_p1_GENE_NODE_300_length_4004_cov_227_496847_g232_i0NODE_300_length_4004_cov_227_496847_g232_i0_p1_ORF_typecomplete_len265_score48_53Myb_DNAbinding/PF00249_31/1e04Myb_DNAbinding/PF00249_31/2_3e07Myb_DNAbind_6/PF13921_6/3_2e03Myb_DNAbind_6/PF13921_6/0_0014_NODE_300_length_4004_cov_227_496847_g232_i019192713
MQEVVNGSYDRLDLHLESFLTHCNFMKSILQHSDILIPRGSGTHSDRRLKALQELHSVLKYCAWLLYQCRDRQSPLLAIEEEPPATLEPIVDVSGCENEPIKTEEEAEAQFNVVNNDADDTDANSSQEPPPLPPPSTRSRSHKRKRRLIDSTPNGQRVPWESEEEVETPIHRNQARRSSPIPVYSKGRRLWTPEETRVFMSLLTQYGHGAWNQMVKTGRINRDNVQLKDKWRTLVATGKLGYNTSRGYFEFDPSKDPPKYRVRH